MKKTKLFLFLNLLAIFISSQILFIPTFLYLSQYIDNKYNYELLLSGVNKISNLTSVIVLTIVSIVVTILFFVTILKQLKEITDSKLKISEFKVFLYNALFIIATTLFYLITFCSIWLYPLANTEGMNDQQISHYTWKRFIIYLITYLAITILFFIIEICLSIFLKNKIIQSYLKDKKVKGESKTI